MMNPKVLVSLQCCSPASPKGPGSRGSPQRLQWRQALPRPWVRREGQSGTVAWAASPQTLGRWWSRSRWQPGPGVLEAWGQPARVYQRQIMPKQPDRLLWWDSWLCGWGETSEQWILFILTLAMLPALSATAPSKPKQGHTNWKGGMQDR